MRKRRGFCNHYRAMSEHDTCEAGVSYETMKGMSFDVRPCFFKGDPPTAKSTACELAMYPTIEELAARDAELAQRSDRMGKAREAIVAACGGKWKKGMPGKRGVIECPNCKGKLHYSRAGYNGNVHAQCETTGCCSWME